MVMKKNITGIDCIGSKLMQLAQRLFPICRSITGSGLRETLTIIQEHIPLTVHEVPTGTQVFDWVVPREWNIRNAFIEDENGNKIVDFRTNNLHVVSYSIPIDMYISLPELQQHLYSLENQPTAIPYVTSYYKEAWGFCLSHNQRKTLREATYHVYIDSELKTGSLSYGELIIPGESEQEVFLSTYVCHPSMANNELSGPVVTTFLAKWLLEKKRRYTYRIVFIPETIGSLTYLSKNLDEMKRNIIAGFNITCVGDDHAYSYLPSRKGNTLADRVALNILNAKNIDFNTYSYLDRGSDERQYCSVGVDLPVASIMRSKYGTYPEYHTSLDNLDFISAYALGESYELLKNCIKLLEKNYKYKTNCIGEPQLGRRGLYPNISMTGSAAPTKNMMNFLAYADGNNDLIDISSITGVSVLELYAIIDCLTEAKLITVTA